MKKLTLLLFSMLTICSASAQETVKLTVSGQGATKEEATTNALRSAIEQSFGVFVSANTQILNDEVVKDEIATISSGNIQEYKELGCITMPNGQQSVTLSATVSIGNLISYAKSKGSSAEFAGQVFAMNMKMRKLNAENEKKAVEHLKQQISLLAPNLFQIKISIDERPKKKTMSEYDFRLLEQYDNIKNKSGVDYYLLPINICYYCTENSKAFYSILIETLQSLALSQSEILEYEDSNERIYTYDQYFWKNYGLDNLGSLAFRSSFLPDLMSFLDGIYRVAMFGSYNLNVLGLNESHKFYSGNRIQLSGRPIYDNDDWQYELGYGANITNNYDNIALLKQIGLADVGTLIDIEKPLILFTLEECSRIEKIEMTKNSDDLLHAFTIYNLSFDTYKAFTEIQQCFIFHKDSHQIEFLSTKYHKDGQWINKSTRIVFDLESHSWFFGNLGSIENSFYSSSNNDEFRFGYGGGSTYYYIVVEKFIDGDYYFAVPRLGEDKSRISFYIPSSTNSIVRTSSGGHIDISSLSSFFYPIEQFYGNLITEEVAYYDERTEQWGNFKDCKANISIDPQASTIKLSGVHDETYKIIFYPDKWTKGDVSQSIILDCISSVGESVRIRFEKPTGATRQLIFYHSNGMTMCFNISSEGRSILKSNYRIHPAGGVNYMFYNNPAKFRQYEDDGTTYELPYSGIVKCSGEMPICITGVFGNFYWEDPIYTDNLVIVEKDGKWGAIDFVDTSNPNGVYGIPFIYDKMEPFDGGKSDAVLNGNRVVVLATDKVFMPFTDFIDNKNPIDIIGETILLDGHHIIPGDAGSYIGFEYKNKIGFAQNASDAIILFCPQYDKVYLEDKYMILVSKDGKWGAIPKWYVEQCDEIPCIYDKMSPFNNGISEVVLNGERFTINMKGEKIQ